ncbi:MAG: cyclase family protein [Burkholderiales bacterium]|nr:cyclase family protein [Burkholderiales bacterium]
MTTATQIVDLTLPVQTGMPGIPGIAFYDKHPVTVRAVSVISAAQRVMLEAEGVDVAQDADVQASMNTVLTLNSHIGTHIDAPRHFIETAPAVDDLPLDRIVMREAIVLDLSHKGPGEGVTADDLEKTGIKPASHQVPVIKTLWTDRAWGTPDFWPRMIYLDPSVSAWINDFGVPAVAMDCFPEKAWWHVKTEPRERGVNHRAWLKAGVIMVQFVTNLAAVDNRFTMIALPLRLRGMDGSPARVVGLKSAS